MRYCADWHVNAYYRSTDREGEPPTPNEKTNRGMGIRVFQGLWWKLFDINCRLLGIQSAALCIALHFHSAPKDTPSHQLQNDTKNTSPTSYVKHRPRMFHDHFRTYSILYTSMIQCTMRATTAQSRAFYGSGSAVDVTNGTTVNIMIVIHRQELLLYAINFVQYIPTDGIKNIHHI